MFINLWLEFARRYGSDKDIAFELLNEITDLSSAVPWNTISKETIAAIRTVAPTTKIIVGGIYNSSIYGLKLLSPPVDENIVLTFHNIPEKRVANEIQPCHTKSVLVDR